MLTIGEAAQRLAVSADTLRYYEKQGLLAPTERTDAGYRLYDREALRRLSFIKHAQQCGFSLAEVRELLAIQGREDACCDDVRHRATEKKLQLEHKIHALQSMSAALSELITVCQAQNDKPLDACPIVAALEAGLAAPSPSTSLGEEKS
jgi:DNA-binding transcriptional MerR regulator